MKELQQAFFVELDANENLSPREYAELYIKHRSLAMEEEVKNGANKYRAKTMGNYYMISVLSGFLNNEMKIEEVMEIAETLDRERSK